MDLEQLLKEYSNLKLLDDKQRVKCTLSGHEMPCKAEVVQSYLCGKKFQKLKALHSFDYEKYKQHIVPSTKKGRGHQLFCHLTLKHLNNKPDHIKHHIEGRRFKKAYARWEECQKTGEKFQPQRGRKIQYEDDSNHGDTDSHSEAKDNESDVDDLSDLYPAGDFVKGQDESKEMEDSCSDFEVSEKEESVSQSSRGIKRKTQPEKKIKKSKKKKKV